MHRRHRRGRRVDGAARSAVLADVVAAASKVLVEAGAGEGLFVGLGEVGGVCDECGRMGVKVEPFEALQAEAFVVITFLWWRRSRRLRWRGAWQR